MRRAAAVTLIATGALLAVTLTAGNEPGPKQPPTAKQVVGYINHQRQMRHLPAMRGSRLLSRASVRWSRYLEATSMFLHASTVRPAGFSSGAETLYRGPGGPVGPWMRSPPHRAIMLSQKAELVGIARTGDVWVGRFGAR